MGATDRPGEVGGYKLPGPAGHHRGEEPDHQLAAPQQVQLLPSGERRFASKLDLKPSPLKLLPLCSDVSDFIQRHFHHTVLTGYCADHSTGSYFSFE